MTRRNPRRYLAGLAGLALLLGLVILPSVSETEAAFTDREYAAATFTGRIKPPVIASAACVRPPAFGGTIITMVWAWPAGVPYTSYTAANVVWKVGTTDPYTMPTTGPDASGNYTSTITTAGLGGLLASLLGSDLRVEAKTTAANGWTSTTVSSMTYNAPLLAGNPTCVIANG